LPEYSTGELPKKVGETENRSGPYHQEKYLTIQTPGDDMMK